MMQCKQYKLHLKTIDDFRRYADMLARFDVNGFIDIRDDKVNMYDILELMSMGPVNSMMLNLTKYTPAQIPGLEMYMDNAHFLIKDPVTADA